MSLAGHPLIRSHLYDPDNHAVDEFDCGVPELDSWLRNRAKVAAAMRTASTYVWLQGGRVVGYYSIAPHGLTRELAPHKIGRSSPDPIPGYIIGKLALDAGLRGQRLGSALLLDAVARLVAASETAAGRVIVVDAINDDARDFYLAHDFVDLPTQSMTPYMKMSTAEATIASTLANMTD